MTSLATASPTAPLQILVPQFLCFALNNTLNNLPQHHVQPDIGKVERDLKKRNKQLGRHVNELNQKLEAATQQNLRLQRQVYVLHNNLTRTAHELQEITSTFTDHGGEGTSSNIVHVIAQLYDDRDTCKTNLSDTEEKLNDLSVDYDNTKTTLNLTETALKDVSTKYNTTEGKLKVAEKELNETTTKYETTKDKLNTTEHQLNETTTKFQFTDDIFNVLVPDRSQLLIEAVGTGNSSLVLPLVRLGTPVTSRDQFGYLALDWAALGGDANVAEILLEGGANVNGVLKEHGDMPLHLTARLGYTDAVKVLLKAGADINAKNVYGNSALHEASYYGHEEIVKILLDKGATVDAKNDEGATSLMFAAEKGHLPVVKLLVQKRADTSLRNQDGRTAEEEALRRGKQNVAYWLAKRL